MTTTERWERIFRESYRRDLPKDYLSFDLETTGFKKDFDLPIDFGYTLVRDSQPIHRGSFLLDWTRHPSVEEDWLRGQLDRIAYGMAKQNKPWQYTYERLRDEGKQPEKVLSFALELFAENRKAGGVIVANGAREFDCVMLNNTWNEYLGYSFQFGANELFDSGLMMKASFCNMWPFDNETLQDYFSRVRYRCIKGMKWNMERCIEHYQLDRKHQLDLSQAHTATFDAYVCYLAYEEHREPL